MKYVKKSYEMMLFWIGFGGLMGFLSYTFAPSVRFLRNLNSFKTIRIMLTILPLFVFSYHGVKFMIAYKRKGAREVGKDPNNILSEEQYEQLMLEQSTVKPKAADIL
jgi:hypothetical protein